MEALVYRKNYQEYKSELDAELGRTAEGFVRIGYLLKVARDTDILRESPYENVVDFAKAEYGIDKTQVSRFIHINDRFSEGGYSDRLEEHYRGFGYAKLAIMLQLPDAVNDILTPSYSKSEIQMLKEEVDAEKSITDLEVMMEETPEGMKAVPDELSRAVRQLGEDEPALYRGMHGAAAGGWQQDAVQGVMAPDGERTYSIRIAGAGRFLLSLKVTENTVTMVNVRSGEKQTYRWEDVTAAWKQIVNASLPAEQSWQETYGKEMPKEECRTTQDRKAAPVQPKKEAKVVRAAKPKKEAEKTLQTTEREDAAVLEEQEVTEQELPEQAAGNTDESETDVPESGTGSAENGSNPEENGTDDAGMGLDGTEPERVDDIAEIVSETIPGQMEVEDYPEMLPEAVPQKSPEEKVAPVQPMPTAREAEKRRREWLEQLKESLDTLYRAAEKGMWAQTERIQNEIDKELDEMKKLEQHRKEEGTR